MSAQLTRSTCSRKAVRMSACAKEPNRDVIPSTSKFQNVRLREGAQPPPEVLHVQNPTCGSSDEHLREGAKPQRDPLHIYDSHTTPTRRRLSSTRSPPRPRARVRQFG